MIIVENFDLARNHAPGDAELLYFILSQVYPKYFEYRRYSNLESEVLKEGKNGNEIEKIWRKQADITITALQCFRTFRTVFLFQIFHDDIMIPWYDAYNNLKDLFENLKEP